MPQERLPELKLVPAWNEIGTFLDEPKLREEPYPYINQLDYTTGMRITGWYMMLIMVGAAAGRINVGDWGADGSDMVLPARLMRGVSSLRKKFVLKQCETLGQDILRSLHQGTERRKASKIECRLPNKGNLAEGRLRLCL